jgi:hypothetical protein
MLEFLNEPIPMWEGLFMLATGFGTTLMLVWAEGEVAHRLRGIDGLCAGRLVDCEWVVTERRRLRLHIGDFGFDGAAAVAEDDGAVALKTFVGVDGKRVFLSNS